MIFFFLSFGTKCVCECSLPTTCITVGGTVLKDKNVKSLTTDTYLLLEIML